jgi:hypothetical protein
MARYQKYGNLSEVKEALQSSYMWNVFYVPVELGTPAVAGTMGDAVSHSTSSHAPPHTHTHAHEQKGPIVPPTREWTWLAQNPRDLEWAYVMFDWDNYFSSYIAGLDPLTKNVSYSNLIQITKVLHVFLFVSFRFVSTSCSPPAAGSSILGDGAELGRWRRQGTYTCVLGHPVTQRKVVLTKTPHNCLSDCADGGPRRAGHRVKDSLRTVPEVQ